MTEVGELDIKAFRRRAKAAFRQLSLLQRAELFYPDDPDLRALLEATRNELRSLARIASLGLPDAATDRS